RAGSRRPEVWPVADSRFRWAATPSNDKTSGWPRPDLLLFGQAIRVLAMRQPDWDSGAKTAQDYRANGRNLPDQNRRIRGGKMSQRSRTARRPGATQVRIARWLRQCVRAGAGRRQCSSERPDRWARPEPHG